MIRWIKSRSVRHACAGRFLVATAASLTLLVTSCHDTPIQLFGEAQGTYYSIQYYDSEGRDFQGQIDSLLADFDQTASLWVDSSLLRRINENQTTALSPLLSDLLHKSDSMRRYTDGAFDIRLGRLVRAWGFSFKQREELAEETRDSLLRAARSGVWVVGDSAIVKQDSGTELDLNAIAQGYSSDLIAAWLEGQGVCNYLVDIGGEVVARGKKAGGQAWRVGIEQPAAERYSAPVVLTSIELHDMSVVTSGSYRKYYEKDGHRYSHTIDPATGRPVTHSLLSVSVVEKECWLADAMATAYMVMGLERAKEFIASHAGGPGTGAVMFIYDEGGKMSVYTTPGFEDMQTKTHKEI